MFSVVIRLSLEQALSYHITVTSHEYHSQAQSFVYRHISFKWVAIIALYSVFFLSDSGQFYSHPSGLLHWHWVNHAIAPVPLKQHWRIWVNELHAFSRTQMTPKSTKCMGYTRPHQLTCSSFTVSDHGYAHLCWNGILLYKSIADLPGLLWPRRLGL